MSLRRAPRICPEGTGGDGTDEGEGFVARDCEGGGGLVAGVDCFSCVTGYLHVCVKTLK